MKKLDGQIVVITGGARGIGEGICKIFCNEGAIVFIWDVLEEGQKTADKIKADGVRKTTLGGCLISSNKNCIILKKEKKIAIFE